MISLCRCCFKLFLVGIYRKIYCSEVCYKLEKARRLQKKRGVFMTPVVFIGKPCPQCSKRIGYKRNRKRSEKVFCSSECFHLSRRKYLNIPDCLESADRKIDKNLGYVRLYCPMHPESNTWGYVYEHRVIAEKTVGRRLNKNEIVHHKNGIRWDNRPENLEVMDKRDHGRLRGQRPEDLDI